jgi:acetyl esterase/lipase
MGELTMEDPHPALDVAARRIPVPTSISPEAQAFLARGPLMHAALPALDDLDAWRKLIAVGDEAMVVYLSQRASGDVAAEEVGIEGVRVYALTPSDVAPDDRRVYLELHGGGFVMGGGEACRAMGSMMAARVGLHTWAVDYRMPPDHPYPAALDDCFTVYRALLREREPHEIVIGGGSAGGNLSVALGLRARDEGLPLPAAIVVMSPAADQTHSGDTFQTNRGVDTSLPPDVSVFGHLYAAGHDPTDPYLSPVFGDFSRGFCPTLIASGTRDLLLSNAVRLHRALRAHDVPAELHVLEAAPHQMMAGTPEDEELRREINRFIARYCPAR